ncbi:MAG TPA: CRISPR-associated protein Cas4 [Deltaproteobacteria bacterium]|nr:CRISPR-associated protein Cas4 [Deltaproteobacteria bacterium]
MSYLEDDLISISALAHYSYCPRRCALIHIEQIWTENLFTVEGRIMHENAHDEKHQSRKDVRIESGVPLRSLKLGLIGKADVIEFHRREDGTWLPYPVEYKRGKPKRDNCDRIQLCAQALCLEEMLGLPIPEGALFYGKTRHRLDVVFDDTLRSETKETALKTREIIASGKTPAPVYAKRCERCSLMEICLPRTVQKKRTVRGYLTRMVKDP